MFENILGQKKIKNVLASQLKSGKFPHAYIFMGQNGVGKRHTAVELAKVLNCTVNDWTKTDAGACGKCSNCEKISHFSHPDLHFIDFAKQAEMLDEDIEKQKTLKIETIREMQKEVLTKAHEAKWKIFIVEPAEKMNAAAANSLLKTLEEPPDNTLIILIARHKETIAQTIVSRSQTLFFEPLGQNEIASYLMLNNSLAALKAEEIAAIAEGSIEDAQKLIDPAESEGLSLWLKIKNENLDAADILNLSRKVAKDETLEYIGAMTAEAKKDFRLYPHSAIKTLEYLNNARALILKNVNAQTVMDNLLLDLYDLKKTSKMFKL
ncbi:DNA polymerase III subunit delta' [Endomicrobium proavitum]|uniref:DNA polymerase III delta subunit n=1 Tax=Endomicrobium proavitum TaxID=1408281 RepID=A0A0G3WJ17_9BACT|nr:DNA polymerase III subunit delta' [Endomicrobium proavitum]AKL97444.1 DNA polymerase III delta subunit [Endomicrobium proavitum]